MNYEDTEAAVKILKMSADEDKGCWLLRQVGIIPVTNEASFRSASLDSAHHTTLAGAHRTMIEPHNCSWVRDLNHASCSITNQTPMAFLL